VAREADSAAFNPVQPERSQSFLHLRSLVASIGPRVVDGCRTPRCARTGKPVLGTAAPPVTTRRTSIGRLFVLISAAPLRPGDSGSIGATAHLIAKGHLKEREHDGADRRRPANAKEHVTTDQPLQRRRQLCVPHMRRVLNCREGRTGIEGPLPWPHLMQLRLPHFYSSRSMIFPQRP
jgi:hypothetical protein